MLLADYAVVSDGKLTIVGGGWSQTGPEPASFGIGLLIQVPWDQANTRHSFSVELDRKSTRLNSSHLGISYAVFCLKKKTKTQVTTTIEVQARRGSAPASFSSE